MTGDETVAERMVRRRRAAIAGHQGRAADARALLVDPDPTVTASALRALARCGDLRVDDLADALSHQDPQVRACALELVAANPPTVPTEALSILPLLRDPDETVVEVAAWACGERQPPEPGAVVELADLATSAPDALVRESAVASLGAIGDPAGLPAVLAATEDKATVRRRAVLALAPFDGPEVDAALVRATEDRDWQVRQAAEDLLAP